MKIVAIADLHGRLPGRGTLARIPECDILLIAGDICAEFTWPFDPDIMRIRQMEWLASTFAEWETEVPARHILMTPGNHDWIIRLPEHCRSRLFIDEAVTIEGCRFYFTPWVPPVAAWNYMADRAYRKRAFADIPTGLDVLVSHSSAHRVLDLSYTNEHCGCRELRQAIYRAKPRVMVHGHIHEGQRGGNASRLGRTQVYNVAIWREEIWRPTILDLPKKDVDSSTG